MKITGDYHTHTSFSHGKGTIEESVQAAIAAGLHVIAITEHSYGHIGFGVKKPQLFEIKKEIDRLKPLYPDITIKFGLEANILDVDGNIDVDDDLIEALDFILAGYHFGSSSGNLLKDLVYHGSNLLQKVFPPLRKGCINRNTQAMVNAMKKYPLFALTHPGAKGPIDIHRVAKVAFEQNVLLEINAHHGHLTVEEIVVAKNYHVRFIIDSDAHEPSHIARFDLGLQRAIDAGLSAEDVFNAHL